MKLGPIQSKINLSRGLSTFGRQNTGETLSKKRCQAPSVSLHSISSIPANHRGVADHSFATEGGLFDSRLQFRCDSRRARRHCVRASNLPADVKGSSVAEDKPKPVSARSGETSLRVTSGVFLATLASLAIYAGGFLFTGA